jgi:GNAT superfamily N-acetyltransferase
MSPVRIRRATVEDATEVADLYWRARQAAVPAIPPPAHPRGDVTRWIRDVVLPAQRTWIATRAADADASDTAAEGSVVGVLVVEDPDWIDQLYVDPEQQHRGIGSELLALALEQLDGRARLWCFRSNTAARRFYERHGFVATAQTDGDNEEGEPDVRYERR